MATHGTKPQVCSREHLISLQAESGRAFEALPNDIASNVLSEKTRYRQLLLELVKKEFAHPSRATTESAIRRFYKEVLSKDIALSDISFPKPSEGFNTYMAVLPGMSVKAIISAYKKKWPGDYFTRDIDKALKLNRHHEQERPSEKGPYVFAHRGGALPDKEHLGKKRYFDLKQGGMKFMNVIEYLLATGYHRFFHDQIMDNKNTWTMTSSEVGAGYIAMKWKEIDDQTPTMWLEFGLVFQVDPTSGPREIILSS